MPPHFMVLELLAGRHPQILEGAPAGITVSEIARAMGLAPATTTATLDKLESSGYLRRAADPHDRRVVRVQLTPQGQEVLEALHTRGSALYQDMLSRFGLEELQVLQNILNGVYDWHVERSSANGGG
nr:MarR family transcriptional regulator [Deinobacterium chartae]